VSQKELNLGILAHVDAGKTTLTERLLYEAGVIKEPGSVDAGTTQTDSLTLERERGITIRSAVTSFTLGDVHVNLIDTPGHPDFIAEVERVLGVLDGAVLVVSAVEGVQPQTRILMRALKRLGVPTLIFVNKIDRGGADGGRTLRVIADRLTSSVVAMETVDDAGSRVATSTPIVIENEAFRAHLAEVLGERDDELLVAYLENTVGSPERLRRALATQTRAGLVHPVFFGSAITGAGVSELLEGVVEFLPSSDGDPNGPVAATVFKIERNPGGEKVAYVRMFSGTIRTRERLSFGRDRENKVTSISVFERGGPTQQPAISAGAVGKLWGLAAIQIGDRIGATEIDAPVHHFAPPTLESNVVACDPAAGARLRAALAELADEDPLIDVRQDEENRLAVSLYGEVQKEVIEATLAADYGIDVTFHETTPLYIERPISTGEAVEVLHAETNPYLATIGLRVDPASAGSGFAFRMEIDHTGVPLYLYKRHEHFAEAMERYVRDALDVGRFGWRVTDCLVALTQCVYSVPDGPPSRRGPLSTAADFRKLTPIVVAQALEHAGTVVCEPFVEATVEAPSRSASLVLGAVSRLGATTPTLTQNGDLSTVTSRLPVAELSTLRRQLPALTAGEGVLDTRYAGHEPVTGPAPSRPGGGS
jgi:ribosomal protection tetracycline resistance protein